jgi:DNA polymerase III delta prime subunit
MSDTPAQPAKSKPVHPLFLGAAARKALSSKSVPNTSQKTAEDGGVEIQQVQARTKADAHKIVKLKYNPKSSVRSSTPDITLHTAETAIGFDGVRLSPKKARTPKFQGAVEAAWPAKGTAHVRNLGEQRPGLDSNPPNGYHNFTAGSTIPQHRAKKLKGNVVNVLHEDNILTQLFSNLHKSDATIIDNEDIRDTGLGETPLRVPKRILSSGTRLQRLARKQLESRLSSNSALDDSALTTLEGAHPAIMKLYKSIGSYLSPYDKARCETQSWAQKYAPQSTDEVLQSGRNSYIVRDWLVKLKVNSVDTGENQRLLSKDNMSTGSKRSRNVSPDKSDKGKPGKRRKKKNPDLEGFVISSGEEDAEMDEVSDPDDDSIPPSSMASRKKTVIRVGDSKGLSRLTNAIVINGPHGCGKTAMVYAVAKELDFEVFEVNAGSRRSQKDILDKIGDMSKNHLVRRANDVVGPSGEWDLDDVQDALTGNPKKKNKAVNSFFKPRAQQAPPEKTNKSRKPEAEEESKPKEQHLRQSLILLEEVDILFQEDAQFWSTVFTLIAQSKRPFIMTCSDDSVVPLNALVLYAIIYMTPPPEDLATDYLLLMAAKEGHILQREAVKALYEVKHYDLRASIMDLDFWCQMGVGDRKGGLEWLLTRWPPGSDINEEGDTVRVASKGTYQTGMGWFCRDNQAPWVQNTSKLPSATTEEYEELLSEAWSGWHFDVEDWHSYSSISKVLKKKQLNGSTTTVEKQDRKWATDAYESFLEDLSASDVYAGRSLRIGNQVSRIKAATV